MKKFIPIAIAVFALNAVAADQPRDWQPLLDATLSNFDVYLSYRGDQIMSVIKGTAPADLKPVGLNPASQNVVSVIEQDGKPVLRITGEYYGCVVTKQEYSNYRFRAQFKWGDKKWEPRLNEPKDSGILYHSRGEFGVDYWKSWALSQEFQVIEHGIGEYWTQATSAFDIRVDAKKEGDVAPRWNPTAPWKQFSAPDNHALAGSDQDKPGQWNSIELVCYQGDCVHLVNGKVVMALAHSRYKQGDAFVPLTGGKLQIQSEAAEVFYRDLAIQKIDAMPKEFVQVFRVVGSLPTADEDRPDHGGVPGGLSIRFATECRAVRSERPRAAVLLTRLANFEDVKARSERRTNAENFRPEILEARSRLKEQSGSRDRPALDVRVRTVPFCQQSGTVPATRGP